MSKWKTIDSAPIGVAVWAKVEGNHPITGEPYEKAKVMFANHPTKGVVATHYGVNYPNWLPIEGDLNTTGNWPLTHWKPLKKSKWIVKNPKKLLLKEMSEKDTQEVFKAWREILPNNGYKTRLQVWDNYWEEWEIVCNSYYNLDSSKAYRVSLQPPSDEGEKRLSESKEEPLWELDWKQIDRRYKWAAVDLNGEVYVYGSLPDIRNNRYNGECWGGDDITFVSTNSAIKKPLENVEENWKNSLIKRPEGE